MHLALCTSARVAPFDLGQPALCGVYASEDEASAYVRWENERAEDCVYYVIATTDLEIG